ncbi:hypothetical protein [Bathymodiolus japonicus methanotrophic gill symbiont]|uniref:hypothetical protein n=1 Tax=Bathymodiolus japonicus methanotrophic gill symbiont TaxID=113269 RepID=UPI001C8F18C9|nr:hypothetical protein [Bathymodiolus japonicus methanotrophic gill symbiont]
MAFYFVSTFANAQTPTKQRPYGYRGLEIFTSLKLRFQDFQRLYRTFIKLYLIHSFTMFLSIKDCHINGCLCGDGGLNGFCRTRCQAPDGLIVSRRRQARHAASRHSGAPVTNIHSPTQRMGDALVALRPSQLAGRLFGMQFLPPSRATSARGRLKLYPE